MRDLKVHFDFTQNFWHKAISSSFIVILWELVKALNFFLYFSLLLYSAVFHFSFNLNINIHDCQFESSTDDMIKQGEIINCRTAFQKEFLFNL